MNHETQVGKLKSLRSYWKYCVVYKHLAEFVEKRYKASGIALKELTPAFITDFELFLKVEKNHCNNGYYWAATPNGTTTGRNLNFNSANVNPQNSNNRGNGFPVRCVQEFATA